MTDKGYSHYEETQRVGMIIRYPEKYRPAGCPPGAVRREMASLLDVVNLEDIAESRRLLERTVGLTRTPAQRARAEQLMQAFEFYEASAIASQGSYWLRPGSALGPARPTTEAEALAMVEDSVRMMTAAHRRRRLALEDSSDYPHLVRPRAVQGRKTPVWLEGRDWGAFRLRGVSHWVRRGDNAVSRRVRELAEGAEIETIREEARTLLNRWSPD